MSIEFATEAEIFALQAASKKVEKAFERIYAGEYGFGEDVFAATAAQITAFDALVTALQTAVDAVDAAVAAE